MPTKPTEKIRAAAYYFVFVSQDLKRIARDFRVNPLTVKRWAADPIWHATLEICRYTGPRDFHVSPKPTRDTIRDNKGIYEKVRDAYLQAIHSGTPKSQLARTTSEQTGVSARKIRDWARRYKWNETD